MKILGEMMEVILYVQDMSAQVSFYRDQLGLQVRSPRYVTDFSQEFWVEIETGVCILALHAGGQRRFGVDAPKIVFRVTDIQKAQKTLIERGVQLGEVRSAAPGVWVCDGVDPEGNKFSIESHEQMLSEIK